MDIFMEYMVKRKKNARDYLFAALLLLAALVLSLLILFFSLFVFSNTMGLEYLLIAGAWYGAYLLIRRRNVEYEYTFTNGELDVDAIYAKRYRSHLLTVRARDMQICAPVYTSEYQEEYLGRSGIKAHYFAGSDPISKQLYFADFQYNGELVRLVFEPPRSMVEKMKKYNPTKIHPMASSI